MRNSLVNSSIGVPVSALRRKSRLESPKSFIGWMAMNLSHARDGGWIRRSCTSSHNCDGLVMANVFLIEAQERISGAAVYRRCGDRLASRIACYDSTGRIRGQTSDGAGARSCPQLLLALLTL